MFLPLVLVTIASLLFAFFKFRRGKSSSETQKKAGVWLIMQAVFKFLFRVKSEDRLNSFKTIHKFFPRFTRLTLFNSDNIVIYDPELCKKVFSAQSACQRPFRNCFQLNFGLLSSECKHRKQTSHSWSFNLLI